MSCPRCGGSLVDLSLGENTASHCEACGHVGISTDLEAIVEPEESWEESLQRFKSKQ